MFATDYSQDYLALYAEVHTFKEVKSCGGGEASSLEISRCNSLPFRMTDGHFPPLPCIARENLLIFTVMKTNDQTWQFSSRVNLELSSYKPVDFPQPIFNSGKVSTDTSYPSGSLPPH